MKESPIHKGLIVGHDLSNSVYVWIPTANCAVPNGFSQYLYENTGGQLFGDNLGQVIDSAYKCILASPLTSGSWFQSDETLGVSVFDNYYRPGDKIYDYRIFPNYQGHRGSSLNQSYTLKTDVPAASGCILNQTLSLPFGNKTNKLGTIPVGQFPKLQKNQWVLVAFVNSSINPVVFATLHSEAEWDIFYKK